MTQKKSRFSESFAALTSTSLKSHARKVTPFAPLTGRGAPNRPCPGAASASLPALQCSRTAGDHAASGAMACIVPALKRYTVMLAAFAFCTERPSLGHTIWMRASTAGGRTRMVLVGLSC